MLDTAADGYGNVTQGDRSLSTAIVTGGDKQRALPLGTAYNKLSGPWSRCIFRCAFWDKASVDDT